MKRRGIIKTILLFSAAIGAFAAFVSAVPRPKPLLPESRRVYTLAEPNVGPEEPAFVDDNYQWASDTALLLEKGQRIDSTVRNVPSYRFTVKIHDLQTGRDDELTGLAGQLEKTMKGFDNFRPMQISPDGKRVVWQAGTMAGHAVYAATLQGEQIGWRDGILSGNFVWADNEKVLMYDYGPDTDDGPNVFDCLGVISSQHDTSETIPFSPEAKKNTGVFLFAHGNTFYTTRDNAADGKLYYLTPFCWNVGATVMPAGNFTVHFPGGAWFKQAALSPQVNRVAWLVEREYVSPFQRFMAKFLHRSITPQAQEEILVSNKDGSEMREIGTFDLPPGEYADVEKKINVLRWLPGGRQLSFEHDGGLWTVPAP